MPKALAIISDTPMPRDGQGSLLVFEPTLREVEHLLAVFDVIFWYGMPVKEKPSNTYRMPSSQNIRLIPFPPARGGDSFFQKIKVVAYLPLLFLRVLQIMVKYDFIHTRGPSVPAWCSIIMAGWFRRKRVWHKYAGNWNEQNPPFSYKRQRALLKRSTHPVTVNGRWGDKNPNILSFENPCFSSIELALSGRNMKDFSSGKWHILFVGRLEFEKGIHLVLEAARQLPDNFIWHIVGDGKERKQVEHVTAQYRHIHFWGSLNRHQLNEVYETCHFFLLPTVASEGFPKVIAEACGFGCIPIVSTVSSISQYVSADFGYLLPHCTGAEVVKALRHFTTLNIEELRDKSESARRLAQLFTYERYLDRIRQEVFKIQ